MERIVRATPASQPSLRGLWWVWSVWPGNVLSVRLRRPTEIQAGVRGQHIDMIVIDDPITSHR